MMQNPPKANPRRRRHLGLLPRLILALVLVGSVPLAVVMVERGYLQSSLRKQVLRSHRLLARGTADRVAAFVSERRVMAEALANNPTIYRDPGSEAASELLAGVLLSQPEIVALSLADFEGREFVRAQHRDWAVAGDSVLAGPSDELLSFRTIDGTVWVRIDLPLADQAGVIRQVVSSDRLAEVLLPQEARTRLPAPEEDADLETQTEVLLASTSGNTVFEAEGREGATLTGEAPQTRPSRLVGVGSLDHLPRGLVDKALSGQISGMDGDDPVILGAYAPVEGIPWVVITAQPKALAEAAAERMRRVSWLALAGAVLLTGAVGWGAHGSVIRPIRKLIRDQRSLMGLSTSPKAGGEIEQLQESFSILERRMHDQEVLGKVFLGRYEVLELIGEGGMGTVFRGWDPKLQRPVALKTVRLNTAGDAEARRNQVSTLLHEAVAAARIHHPNVVAVYDVLDQDDVAFVSMELVSGVSLADLLGKGRRLAPPEAVSLGIEIAKGLAAAHQQGVVHHDIKPGNVLLGRNGEIKVVDFGIARFISSLHQDSEKVFGTPGYLAPEAIRGKECGAEGDLFSLGVILYEALTGQRPFTGSTLRQLVIETLRHEPPKPRTIVPSIPAELEEIVMGLLVKEPAARLSPASAVMARLDALPRVPWSLKGLDEENESTQDPDLPHSRFLPTVASDRVA
ncbi:MAG: serine/threonine protein kinase [Acidobacteria bacterium]|nr:serine/threonine protein kinase [Acidobacteriota bacterium]